MESLSLDYFREQQDYQRSLLVPSRKKHKKHKKHKHRSSNKSHRHREHREHRAHRHRSRRSKEYGSVNDQCAVCLDDETALDTRLFPCKHVFHGQCLIEWVKQGENFTCPLCRQQITHFFNLSPNKEINNELISIWNDYYVNADSASASAASSSSEGKMSKIDELKVISKMLTKEMENGAKDIKEVDMTSAVLEEIAKLKNKEINESLGIVEIEKESMQCEESTMNKTIETAFVSKDLMQEATHESVELKTIKMAEIEIAQNIGNEEKEPVSNSHVRKASIFGTMKNNIVVEGNKFGQDGNIFAKLCLPNGGLVSVLFDEFIENCISQAKSSLVELEPRSNNLLVDNEFGRINYTLSTQDTIDNSENVETKKGTIYQSMIDQISVKNKLMNDNDTNDNNNNNNHKNDTLTNMEAGVYAGIGASLVTFALNNSRHRWLPSYITRSGLGATLKGNVPNIAAFFTIYEHLKTNVFGINSNELSYNYHTQFVERFLSAGIASSIAFLPRNGTLNSIGLKVALPLRFAAFFGSFELCKDVAMEWKFLNGNIYKESGNSLSLGEVAASAAIGSVVASAVHYPTTQLIQHGKSILNGGNIAALGVSGVNGSGNMGIGSTVSGIVNCNKSVIIESMYRGWLSQLAKFVPTTVACSCAFEFGKRAVIQRKDH